MRYKPCQYPHCHNTFPAGRGPRRYCDRCAKRAAADNSAAYWRRNHPQAAQVAQSVPPLTDKQTAREQKRAALRAEYAAHLVRQEAS